MGLTNMNLQESIPQRTGDKDMVKDWTEMLWKVPKSYDDFVTDTVRWMEQDEGIRDAILLKLKENPNADSDELTLVLWKCLGIGEPLELIDDDLEVTRMGGFGEALMA